MHVDELQEVDVTGLAAAVAALQQLDAAALRRRWRTLVGGSLPPDLGRPLTLRILAYKLQAQRLGDLDGASRRELAAVIVAAGEKDGRSARDIDCTSAGTPRASVETFGREEPVAAFAGASSKPALPRTARPGTLLVREHGGILHRVMILDDGVAWNGRRYDSLSKVAFAITGTRWNGPRFFGLRDKVKDADEKLGGSRPNAELEKVSVEPRRAARTAQCPSPRIAP